MQMTATGIKYDCGLHDWFGRVVTRGFNGSLGGLYHSRSETDPRDIGVRTLRRSLWVLRSKILLYLHALTTHM